MYWNDKKPACQAGRPGGHQNRTAIRAGSGSALAGRRRLSGSLPDLPVKYMLRLRTAEAGTTVAPCPGTAQQIVPEASQGLAAAASRPHRSRPFRSAQKAGAAWSRPEKDAGAGHLIPNSAKLTAGPGIAAPP